MYNLSLECISQISFKNICKNLIYLQFYDDGIMFMGSFPFDGMLGRHVHVNIDFGEGQIDYEH